MSQQQNSQYQPSSQNNGTQYQPSHDVPSPNQDPQARVPMNPQGHGPTPNYTDPRLHGYLQPPHPQPSMTHQQQGHQQSQQDHNRQTNQLQYISTPPLVAPGVFQNPNPSPFTTTPRTAVQTTSPPPLRYQCDKCGTTFSRLHDRNRHHESTHSENPPVHKCERCGKQFSRADAKKRHQDDNKCVSSP